MAENSKIEWTTHTWNPWRGCTKVSAGCAHCYAETQSKRNPTVLGEWGPNGTRVFAAPKAWHDPYHWDDNCRCREDRARVFSLSLGDWLEDWPGQMTNHQGEPIYYSPTDPRFDPWTTNQFVPHEHFEPYTLDVARVRLLRTVHDTPHLDWLLLSKRPENWHAKMLAALQLLDKTRELRSDFSRWLRAWVHEGKPPTNVWAGASVENQEATSRIPHLCAIPARVHWLSVEPLLGPLDLRGKLVEWHRDGSTYFSPVPHSQAQQLISWIIVGGESGHGARPLHPDWARSLRDQCQEAGLAFFFKQWGEWLPTECKDTSGVFHGPSMFGGTHADVGRKAAGRLLDGREWSEFPAWSQPMPDLFGEDNSMQRDACISACGRYRWSLSRAWDADPLKPWIAFIMLNPSTADASIDDPTIRRCIAFAKAWGFGGLSVRNLFAFRATQPVELLEADDPVGSENDAAIMDLIGVCSPIVAAWGTGGGLLGRQRHVIEMLACRGVALKCLGRTKDGFPRHPLYVSGDAELIDY